jgi:RNA polymerase sigma-70 factor (ECF subfamily)
MSTAAEDEAELRLIDRSRAGDRAAFAELVALHQGRVRAYIGTYLKWSDVVDDVAQDVFLAAFRTLTAYDGTGPLGLWLLGIARHRVLRHLRRDVRTRRSFEEIFFRGRLGRVEADQDPRRLEEHDARMATLRRCLERLPPGSAEVVARHYFEGQSLAEIARASGKKESAVRMTLLRVRQALRQCLEQAPREGTA